MFPAPLVAAAKKKAAEPEEERRSPLESKADRKQRDHDKAVDVRRVVSEITQVLDYEPHDRQIITNDWFVPAPYGDAVRNRWKLRRAERRHPLRNRPSALRRRQAVAAHRPG